MVTKRVKKYEKMMIHQKSTIVVVESDTEALGHCGSTTTLMVDDNPYELTTSMENLS